MTKTCTKCKKEKPLTEFYVRRDSGREIHGSYCKECKLKMNAAVAKRKAEEARESKTFVFDDHLTNWIVHALSHMPLQEVKGVRDERRVASSGVLVMWDEVEYDGADCAAVCQANQQRRSVQISERMV